jgi:hypothetical protein
MMDGGDAMTIAMILDLRGVTDRQDATVRGLLGAPRQPANLVHFAGPTADSWRVVEVWASPEVVGTCFQSAAPLVADAADGDPTWEDAEW